MPNVTGERLDVAKSDIGQAGFADEVEVLGGGAFGVLVESNWVVCEQSPAAGEAVSGTPRLTVDRSCGDSTAVPSETPSPSETAESSETPSPSEAAVPSETPSPSNEVLTVKNNEELAALLDSHNEVGPKVRKFATKYKGRTIKFKGSIDLVAPHNSYKTIFDILVSSHNYSETTAWGPAFKFAAVQVATDKAFRNYGGGGYVSGGDNVVIVATVLRFDAFHGIFYLDPISVRAR